MRGVPTYAVAAGGTRVATVVQKITVTGATNIAEVSISTADPERGNNDHQPGLRRVRMHAVRRSRGPSSLKIAVRAAGASGAHAGSRPT